MKKKEIQRIGYEKGTETTDNNEIINLINRCDNIFVLQQVVYDDKSQSITIQIHFQNEKN